MRLNLFMFADFLFLLMHRDVATRTHSWKFSLMIKAVSRMDNGV